LNGYVADDLGGLLTSPSTPISAFCIAFRIFVVEQHTDFKLRTQIDCIQY